MWKCVNLIQGFNWVSYCGNVIPHGVCTTHVYNSCNFLLFINVSTKIYLYLYINNLQLITLMYALLNPSMCPPFKLINPFHTTDWTGGRLWKFLAIKQLRQIQIFREGMRYNLHRHVPPCLTTCTTLIYYREAKTSLTCSLSRLWLKSLQGTKECHIKR